jgi:membrane protein required for colicin V production
MTAFDYVLITILVASVVISVLRGLVKEILSLVAWLVAFIVANRYGATMATLLPDWITSAVPAGTMRLVIGFAILFVGTILLGALVNLAVALIIKALGLRIVDRGLGGVFGLARGVLIVMTLVILAGLTDLPHQPVWRDAALSPVAESAVRSVKPWLPPDWARRVNF